MQGKSAFYAADGRWPESAARRAGGNSVAGLQALDQLAHRRHEAVGIERVRGEAEGVVAREHELEFDVVAMGDVLQRLLDAEAPGIGLLAGGAFLVLRPVRELAGREAAYAVDLVVADLERLFRRDEDQRRIRRPQRLGKSLIDPSEGAFAIMRREIDDAVAGARFQGRQRVAH